MEDHAREQVTNRKRFARIIVPILIVMAVTGIWVASNVNTTQTVDYALDNPDFALFADNGIDLDHLKSYGVPMMIYFGTEWCPPCREMKPSVIDLHSRVGEQMIIKIIDTDEMPEFTSNFPVRAIPTQFFFDGNGGAFIPDRAMPIQLIPYVLEGTEDIALTAHEGLMKESALLELIDAMGVKLSDE